IGLAEGRGPWKEPGACAVVGQVPSELRLRGVEAGGARRDVLPESFVVEEPEGSIAAAEQPRYGQRTAGGSAEVGVPGRLLPPVREIQEEIRRVEPLVAVELEHAAVQLIAAGLDGRIDDGGAAPELSAERGALNLELLNRVDAGTDASVAKSRVARL